jgi:hypothetical protein
VFKRSICRPEDKLDETITETTQLLTQLKEERPSVDQKEIRFLKDQLLACKALLDRDDITQAKILYNSICAIFESKDFPEQNHLREAIVILYDQIVKREHATL